MTFTAGGSQGPPADHSTNRSFRDLASTGRFLHRLRPATLSLEVKAGSPQIGDVGFMSSLSISCIVFACIFTGTLLGMLLRSYSAQAPLEPGIEGRRQAGHGPRRDDDGPRARLADRIGQEFFRYAKERTGPVVGKLSFLLDRALAHYGPESKDAREMLRASVADILLHTWPQENPPVWAGRGEGRDRRTVRGAL